MNVLVIGASGATGREVVKRALDRGYSVGAFMRHPEKFTITNANLTVTPGDVTEYASLERAVAGRDAVVSTLGSGNSISSHPKLADGIQNILRTMEHAGIRRFVYLSMLGVGDSRWQLGTLDRYLVLPFLLRNVLTDHANEEAIIKRSTLDWVIVRPPRLTTGPYTGTYHSGEDVKERSLLASVSRADVADFIVKQLVDDQYVRRTPAVLGQA